MFGFLLKVFVIAAIVATFGGIIYLRRGSLPSLQSLTADFQHALANVDTNAVWKNLSASLDALVTHPDKNSPVVLGIKVTNDSLSTVVDVLQNLPPDQVNQIKSAICSPPASPSGRPPGYN